MRKKIIAAFAAFLIFMGVCTLVSRAVYAYKLPMVATETMESKHVEHMVEADGIVEAGGEKPVTYLEGLRIETISVMEGDRVEAGDVLFQIDLSDLQELIDQKKEEIKKVSLQIDTILENQEIARQKKELELQRAREDYDTTARLKDTEVGRAAEGYVKAQEELEENGGNKELEDSLQSAAYGEADVKAQRDQAIKEAGRKVEDIQLPEEASSDLEVNRLTLLSLTEQLDRYQKAADGQGIVTAAEGGVITDISVGAGGRIPDTAVMLISDETLPCQLKVTLDKDQKKYVNLGDPITVKLDGGGTWEDTIRYLAESKTVPGSYEVLIELPEGKGVPGASGKLTCAQPGEKYGTCISPLAIHETDNRSYVYVLKEREGILGTEYYVDEVNIKVLDENDSWAAISSPALDSDSRIIVSSTKDIKKGDVVRAEQ